MTGIEPAWITAACTAVGLLITWTTSIGAAVVWIVKRLDGNKREILADIAAKHEENRIRVDALHTLVIRHETILDPEFNGSGQRARGRQ